MDDREVLESGWGRAVGTDIVVQFGEWQDIATAPDDGRLILVTGGSRHGRNVKVVEADGAWWRYESRLKALPTHWMPLPPPPGEQ